MFGEVVWKSDDGLQTQVQRIVQGFTGLFSVTLYLGQFMVRLPPMILNLLFFSSLLSFLQIFATFKERFPAGNATIEFFFLNFISKSIVPFSQIFRHCAKLISGIENVFTVTGYCPLYHLLTRKINLSWIQYQAQEINLSTICSQSIPGLSPGRDYQYLSMFSLTCDLGRNC